VTYVRCAEYGIQVLFQCLLYSTEWSVSCISWVWKQLKSCSWWSFLVCLVFAIVSTLVCSVFALVATIICTLITAIELVVCMLWTPISIIFCLSKANGGSAFLLTDGTVMMQECKSVSLYWLLAWGTTRWWKLTPDKSGSYAKGSWSQLADCTTERRDYASAVLADGRLVVCGGEWSDASGAIKNDDTNSCEIYDPVANSWKSFDPPTPLGSTTPWKEIGDAPCAVLPDGTFLLGSINDGNVAKLNPATLEWTPLSNRGISSDEDSWVLMPDNTIAAPSCQNPPWTYVYDIPTDHWQNTGKLTVGIVDPEVNEIGPGLLRYDGTAFFIGANGHTAVYSANATPQWSTGPDLPAQTVGGKPTAIGIYDGPGTVLVNGNVLFGAGARVTDPAGSPWSSPSWFFEFDGTTFNRTTDPPNNAGYTYLTRMLLLPNGDVLFCREDDNSFYAYHSESAQPEESFRPVIQNCPTSLAPGSTIQVSGLQFNGLSQANGYGDDFANATNYPLVYIVNNQTNHLRYCRTHDHTTVDSNGNVVTSMGVATGSAVITTQVDIPGDIDPGDAQLFVVANGIPSQPFAVSIWPEIV
jgi:Kelch motif